VQVDVTWPPQKTVWVAIAISIVALIVCVALLVLDPRRRRRSVLDPPPHLALLWPPSREPHLVGLLPAALATVGAGVAGYLLATPAVGLALAVAMFASLRWVWGAMTVRLVAVAVVLAASLFIFVKQITDNLPPDFGWPQNFDSVHWATMGAVLCLGVDVVAELVRRRRSSTS